MDNAELIKALQNCANVNYEYRAEGASCSKCPYKEARYCKRTMILAAADALEAAEKRIATYQSDVADLEQREKELNEVLNERARLITELNTKCADLQPQINSMESEIEELFSKAGAWIENYLQGVVQ